MKLHRENQERETQGLLEALDALKLKEGAIVTKDQEDELTFGSKTVKILPAWKWMTEGHLKTP